MARLNIIKDQSLKYDFFSSANVNNYLSVIMFSTVEDIVINKKNNAKNVVSQSQLITKFQEESQKRVTEHQIPSFACWVNITP